MCEALKTPDPPSRTWESTPQRAARRPRHASPPLLRTPILPLCRNPYPLSRTTRPPRPIERHMSPRTTWPHASADSQTGGLRLRDTATIPPGSYRKEAQRKATQAQSESLSRHVRPHLLLREVESRLHAKNAGAALGGQAPQVWNHRHHQYLPSCLVA